MRRRVLAALPPLLATAACAPLVHGPVRERALAPASALSDRSFQQALTLRFDATVRTLIAAGEIRDGRLALSLLTPQGLEALRLRHDSGVPEVVHRRGLPPALTPRAILADFQLVHWPAAALRAAWGEGWRLEAGPRRRTASHGGRARVRVTYAGERWRAPATLEDESRGYRLRVEPLELCLRDVAGSGTACGTGVSSSP